MAFYTSRVDDDGNEIERRLSSRSLAPSVPDSQSSSRTSFTSRSYDSKSSSVRMSTRRYLNTAVYVENSADGHDLPNMCDGNSKSLMKSESQSDIVPPLDLQSEENYPTTRDYTFSYRKHCEAAKLELKPDLAYETWLSAKRKVLSDEAEQRKNLKEAKRKELEERKRISQEQYDKWLENKARQPRKSQPTSQSTLTQQSPPHISISQLTEEEAKNRLDEWELTKRKQLERRRRLKREEEEKQRELEEIRRKAAAEAWANWSAGASKKPNPVPLNRGIFTLRGTISDIFVNPNEWQPILPTNGDGDN